MRASHTMLLRLTPRRPGPAVARTPLRRTALSRVVLLCVLAGGGALAPPGAAQDPGPDQGGPPAEPERDEREAARRAEAALERFDEGLDERDSERIRESLVELAGLWPQLPEKTHRKVYKAVRTLFTKLRPRDEIREDGTDDAPGIRYAYETAVGLVFDKPDGAEVLEDALKQGHVREWPEVQAHILTGLGFRQDPEQLDLLADHLDHEAHAVAAAAARGLGRLSEQDGEVRREACAEILDAWSELARRAEREARKDPDGELNRQMQLLESPFTEALTALSRQHHRGHQAWRRWWDEDADEAGW